MPSTSFSFHECGVGKENKKVKEGKKENEGDTKMGKCCNSGRG
jgi:hypothetical protein